MGSEFGKIRQHEIYYEAGNNEKYFILDVERNVVTILLISYEGEDRGDIRKYWINRSDFNDDDMHVSNDLRRDPDDNGSFPIWQRMPFSFSDLAYKNFIRCIFEEFK